ncbi:MAG: MFS transporter [Candidatus Hydrogenedentota bacterium]
MSLERNARMYPWFRAVFSAHFWLPVFFLYFSSRFSLADVLRLEAIYYIAVVILEVPSGYVSDSMGRRPTLLIATIAIAAAHGLFFFGDQFIVFALAQVCLAIGLAFNSGTDTSFLYDTLVGLDCEEEFADWEARAVNRAFLGGAFAAVCGGAIAMVELRYAYALAFLAALTGIGIVLSFVEPTVLEKRASLGEGITRQLRACASYLREPALLWLFAFYVLMTVLNHMPYIFYQPYLDLLLRKWEVTISSTPLVSGVVTALSMMAASWAASGSVKLRDRWGLAAALLSSTALQLVIMAAMALVIHPAIVLLILLRSCPRALMTAPLNAAIAPRVPQAQRATYLSMQSLAGRLSFAAVLLVMSVGTGGAAEADPERLRLFMGSCTIAGIAGMVVLGVSARSLRNAHGAKAG